MELSLWLILFSCLVQASVVLAVTNTQDTAGLTGIAASWNTKPSNWVGNDPCGDKWVGIICIQDRVTSIRLSSFGLSGSLSGDIQSLSELQYLDLSYNKDLGGSLPSSIGSLSNLQNLILVGCSFTGEIPTEIGQLSNLIFLSLNSNRFTGRIPPSLGGLSKLYWFDLAGNKLTGGLPVYDGINLGLDNLTSTKHFHFGVNQLSGTIPSQIFSSHMKLIHLLLDNNNFSGSIPHTLGLLNVLEVLRFDNNYQLSGSVPTNINNLTKLAELHLENNQLTGPLPDLTGMNSLSFVDMSNNSFNASDDPSWLTALQSLTSLYLENLGIGGQLPEALFRLPAIQTLRLRGNRFNGTLNIGSDFSTQLQKIDLQDNQITAITTGGTKYNKQLILSGNPICNQGSTEQYCETTGQSNPTSPSYTTTKSCAGLPPTCLSSQLLSPSCTCAMPYKGTLFFRAPSFSDLTNVSYYIQLEQGMKAKFLIYDIPVGAISLDNPFVYASNNLGMDLEVFPSNKILFGEQDISGIGFILSNQTYKPPPIFGPYYFIGQQYPFLSPPPTPMVEARPSPSSPQLAPLEPRRTKPRVTSKIVAIPASVISFSLVTVLFIITLCICKQRARRKRQELEEEEEFGELQGTPMRFTFQQLKVATDEFMDKLGEGGFGSVFKGQFGDDCIAVKRLDRAGQGKREFSAEVQTIGSIHHVNLVRLIGFCAERSHRLLVYEYMPKGSLDRWIYRRHDNNSPPLDWSTRCKIITHIAKSLSYLHEECTKKIAHLDVKPQNILLDENFNAKLSDFGLCKLIDRDISQVVTRMRGTPGYLAPEWLTSQITEKADIYSFGVVIMEVISGRKNIGTSRSEESIHLITLLEEKVKHDNLVDLIDKSSNDMQAHKQDVIQMMKLAMWCLQIDCKRRPKMSEVVKVLEGTMNADSNIDHNFVATNQATFGIAGNVTSSVPPIASHVSGPR